MAPFTRILTTQDGEMRFDHATLLHPMRANTLVAQAGLLGVDPMHLHSPLDPHVYLVGDLLDTVSPLFGHHPKTTHIATRQGAAAALQIVANSRSQTLLTHPCRKASAMFAKMPTR